MTYLYRALYQRPDSTLRGMTFAARDAELAAKVAADWQIFDTLLVVKPLRPLSVQLTLRMT